LILDAWLRSFFRRLRMTKSTTLLPRYKSYPHILQQGDSSDDVPFVLLEVVEDLELEAGDWLAGSEL
jgi:hypothetical protein